MKIVTVLTAKGNNTWEKKHLRSVAGRLLLEYPIAAAKKSTRVEEFFISTEDEELAHVARNHGLEVIQRPDNLALPDTNHGDVISHAVDYLFNAVRDDELLCVILLGNNPYISDVDIDVCIDVMVSDPELTGVMTAWKAADDHPYRALALDEAGYVTGFGGPAQVDTNRQSYPDVFYYDQGPWVFRTSKDARTDLAGVGPRPWHWMGDKVRLVERPWITGKDVHSELDIIAAEAFLGADSRVHDL